MAYGMFATFETTDAAALKSILSGASASLPGCKQYHVCEDLEKKDIIHVFEIWESKEAHDSSLKLPDVKAAIRQAIPLLRRPPQSVEFTLE